MCNDTSKRNWTLRAGMILKLQFEEGGMATKGDETKKEEDGKIIPSMLM